MKLNSLQLLLLFLNKRALVSWKVISWLANCSSLVFYVNEQMSQGIGISFARFLLRQRKTVKQEYFVKIHCPWRIQSGLL